jgi:2,3-bisphosphoglycerate-independent phosphoglycerate mutase
MEYKKVILAILDGWGIGSGDHTDAIFHAKTPIFDHLLEKYPNATLLTHGENVGLPDGQMGNSEVGHINIGAGRIVYQELARINKSIRDGELATHEILRNEFLELKNNGKSLHIIGLVSDGGVHSHINHLLALINISENYGLENVHIHAFLDGRDTDPKGGKAYLETVMNHCKNKNAKIASVIGRYYAMDRDNRWERVEKAYNLLVRGMGENSENILDSIDQQYITGITDEFMIPLKTEFWDEDNSKIKDGDTVLFFNFRTDRPRQLTRVLSQSAIESNKMVPLDISMITFANYDSSFHGLKVLYEKQDVSLPLGDVISQHELKQLRIAETEKYPHVTFFFSGGKEDEVKGEKRILIPSPKVPTYDLMPEMSANEITDSLISYLQSNIPDFVCLNFANADMVGHTGDFKAAIKAAETVDQCLGKIIDTALSMDYVTIVIADHGNSDFMVNKDGSPNTAHTTNPVPIIIAGNEISKSDYKVADGILADVAPTILYLMGLKIPDVMTGKVLIGAY